MKWSDIKIPTGRFMTLCQIAFEDDRIFLKFPYNKTLLEATKEFAGRKWHGYDDPPVKMWSFVDSGRNRFRLNKLKGDNVFQQWDKPLEDFPIPARHLSDTQPLWAHQIELYRHVLTRRQSIIAGDMGTGKTRVAIMVAEYLQANFGLKDSEAWFVGPINAVNAVNRELIKWSCPIQLRMFTYDGLITFLESYDGPAPRLLIADEASKLKNWKTQRTQAVWHLTESMRYEHGNECYIVEMSGTPAPKAPTDWWSTAEIARPGFLKETSTVKLRDNLCLIEERENASGGLYPHIITWLDDESKCSVCGQVADAHDEDFGDHMFHKSENMLTKLYGRLKGLVNIKRIDECLDLPEMRRRVIRVKPSMNTIRAAQLIRTSSHRAPQKLILLRELSDGFQYTNVEDGFKECPRCHGLKEVNDKVIRDGGELWEQVIDVTRFEDEKIICPVCEGEGVVQDYTVQPIYVETPKDAFLEYLLEEYAEYGRFVVWAAFTATIDHIVEICINDGWIVLRIDGRGLHVITPSTESDPGSDLLLECMDYSSKRHDQLLRDYPKVIVVSHPKSGGMAYTFTAAPADLYYSNDFNAEDKIQSGARIRRGGMCTTRGVQSFEIVHLPEDMLILDNLDTKKNLQGLTLNDLTNYKFDTTNTEFFHDGAFRD